MMTPALIALTASLQAAAAPCAGADYEAFDFWVGRWEVEAGGKTVGTNLITKEENGCLIVERWTNASGGTGQSYNYFDPSKNVWRQVWVSAGVIIDYEGGLDSEGVMALEGYLTPRAGGEPQPFRGRWTDNDDGTVRQEFWIRNQDADEWSIWFDGLYRRAD